MIMHDEDACTATMILSSTAFVVISFNLSHINHHAAHMLFHNTIMLHGSTYSLEHNTTSYEREEQNVKRAASSTLTPPKMLVPTFVLDATPHYSPLLINEW